ncbi:MAG: ATP-binding cassette domain-containing protein [Aristaeellaceae bacterium]
MLQLSHIQKQYKTGELVQKALCDVSLSFRDNEFVSVLGPSGSGKTTLLNIIGGLDRYDSGDLVINGISTKKYKDRDWDSYRNHTIGFVFQSYNLIPHQSVLANVELALTISGISRKERRNRAKKALEEVGLGDQLHKKPSQMSGGQMQRVAIARALVNNPDILLADEPTGALDTETSIQVMELLKKVADKRLVVMVTHNPELAEQYSNRVVKLRDGKIVDDSNPYIPEEQSEATLVHKNMGKAKMSFLTSLSLSFNNLRTKKGRTILTSIAGSIGIIGIALILALSTGVQGYIDTLQKETMASYPITISEQSVDVSSMAALRGEVMMGKKEDADTQTDDHTLYANYSALEMQNTISGNVSENDLTAFKKYLDDPESEIHQYIGENGIVYTYNVNFKVYTYDKNGKIVNTDADTDEITGGTEAVGLGAMMSQLRGQNSIGSMQGGGMSMLMNMSSLMGGSTSAGASNFEELMAGTEEGSISTVITDNYDLLNGEWPSAYNQVVLVLSEDNSLSAATLYQLGIITEDEFTDIAEKIERDEEVDTLTWKLEDVTGHTFCLIPACDYYIENDNGTFSVIEDDSIEIEGLISDALQLEVVGVIRPKADAEGASISAPVAYTSALTDYVISHSNESAVIKAQEADESVNVLTGLPFEALDEEGKIEYAKTYLKSLSEADKASMYTMIRYAEMQNSESQTQQNPAAMGGMTMDNSKMAAALDSWLADSPDRDILLAVYEDYIAGSSFEENLTAFGKVSYDAPSAINIYADSFENKDFIAECIEHYNEDKAEEQQITYTDYVAMLTSSITSIINVISYVLIAFVAVSLAVSCIMIGIVTYISVIERTKEIGVLRALGASKKNISQVFNAETFIIGICSGAIGVGVSALITIPVNAILGKILGAGSVNVALPVESAVVLVVISIIVTVIGGLYPSKKAAKKDPVIALRTE